MQFGDIEGKNIIYNDDGSPILQKDEKVICEFHTKCGINYINKGSVIGKKVLVKGKGTIFLTNKRFIHIRFPRNKTSNILLRIVIPLIYDIIKNEETKVMIRKKIFDYIAFELKEEFEFIFLLLRGEINFKTDSGTYWIYTKKYVLKEIKNILEEEHISKDSYKDTEIN
jgi:hypothetical protein